jgi:biopolymer transport protein ExbD
MNFRKQSSEEPTVNLTPLIDVVFLLLIFFMVSTTFQKDNHITLTLPKADNTLRQTKVESIYISVNSAGEYAVNSRALVKNDANTLSLAIQNLNLADKSTPVIIAADAMSSHQSVVTVMDVAGRLGFNRVSIATTEQSSK